MGDLYDKKLDYEKALRINREAYSLCESILDWYNREINKFLKQAGDCIDDFFLKNEFWFAYHNFKTDYNYWMKQIIEEQKKLNKNSNSCFNAKTRRINSMEQVIINKQELIQELVDELAKEQSIYLRYVVFNAVFLMLICVYAIFY